MRNKMQFAALTASLVLLSSIAVSQTLFGTATTQPSATSTGTSNQPLSPGAFQNQVKTLGQQKSQQITANFNQQLKPLKANPPSIVAPPSGSSNESNGHSPIPPPKEELQQAKQSPTTSQPNNLERINPATNQIEPTSGTAGSATDKSQQNSTYTGFGTGPTGGGGTQNQSNQPSGLGIRY